MGPSIAALIVISVLLTAVVVMFRATQIGATLMANATRANAERVADVANTSFDISSVSTTTDWYDQAEPVNPPNEYGCKPIVSGIERTGEVTVADPYQCYWFDGNDGSSIDVYYYRGHSRAGADRLSVDLYGPNTDPSTGWGYGYFDDPPRVFRNLNLDRGTGRYRIKAWSVDSGEGIYTLKVVLNTPVPPAVTTCVESFQITNNGSKSFSNLAGMDVIASIGTTTMTRLTETLSETPGANEWSVTLSATTTVDGIVINNDVYEKGILNTDELLELRVKLVGYTSESGTITVVLPNGVSSTKTFDLLCNN